MRLLTFIMLLLLIHAISCTHSGNFVEVKSCINKVFDEPPGNSELASKCYDMALPLALSNSLHGKALYLRTLETYLASGTDRLSYDSIGRKMSHYYLKFISQHIQATTLKDLDNDSLIDLFEALYGTEFYASIVLPDSQTLPNLELIFKEIARRNIASQKNVEDFYQALLKAAQWEKARILTSQWEFLKKEYLPRIVTSVPMREDELAYYQLSPDLNSLELKKFEYKNGAQILMVGDCHLASDAMKLLSGHGQFSNLMKNKGLVIGRDSLKEIGSLRNKYPAFEIRIPYRPGAWFQKNIDTFSMPSFYFFRDGVIKYQFSGMTKYLTEDFCRGLKSIDLEAKDHCRKIN